VETRPYRWAVTGLIGYYVLLGLSIGGTVLLRRRRIPSYPLWAVGLDVVCSVILTFGQTRYRTTFEVALVLLAAVQLEWLWSRLRGGNGPGSDAQEPVPDLEPSDPVDQPPPEGVPGSGSPDGSGDRPGVPAVTT
jgi:hypothetical protein